MLEKKHFYSFKIFLCFWLAIKILCPVHHNQLLIVNQERRILCIMWKNYDVNHAANCQIIELLT